VDSVVFVVVVRSEKGSEAEIHGVGFGSPGGTCLFAWIRCLVVGEGERG